VSPIRLSTGRTVSPLKRPRLAAARDLVLLSAPPAPFPTRKKLDLQVEGGPRELAAELSRPTVLKVNGARLAAPYLVERTARLESPRVEAPGWKDWPLTDPVGERLPGYFDDPLPGPAPLPASLLEGEESQVLATLIPRLAPPLLTLEDPPIPEPIPEHVRQAAQALLAEPSLLVADDQGTGKRLSACLALGALLQQGRARRVVILTPDSQSRTWAGLLSEWCPAVDVLFARGEGLERRRAWKSTANIIVTTLQTFADDLSRGSLDPKMQAIDVLLVDSALAAIHLFPKPFSALAALPVPRRWALAGGLPPDNDDWRVLFHYLLPQEPLPGPQDSLTNLRERYGAYYLRRTKADKRSELGAKKRTEIWLDLDEKQRRAYGEALAEERHRLTKLGTAVTRTHIETAMARLNQATAFAPGSFDGIKMRALLDLLESVVAGDDKLIVFSQYGERALDQLVPPLEAYGALRLPSTATEAERDQILSSFRRDTRRHLLLADLEARGDGQPMPASHVLHFDVSWNSARRSRAEIRFYPELRPETPLNLYEFWVADTHDENLHYLLDERHLLPRDLPHGTQPAELEERLSMKDWLETVFSMGEDRRKAKPEERAPTTGLLPGTASLRLELEALSEEELLRALEQLMQALGFPHAQRLETPAEGGDGVQQDVIAWRQGPAGEEKALGRVIRSDKNIGVAEGRALLEMVEERGDCLGGYLVTTADFTNACKTLADESEGRLALVSGAEFYRHLHILRWL